MVSKSRATVFVVLESSFYDLPSGIRNSLSSILKVTQSEPQRALEKGLEEVYPITSDYRGSQ